MKYKVELAALAIVCVLTTHSTGADKLLLSASDLMVAKVAAAFEPSPKTLSFSEVKLRIDDCRNGTIKMDYDKDDLAKVYAVTCTLPRTENECERQFLKTHDELDDDAHKYCKQAVSEYTPQRFTMHPTQEELQRNGTN